MNSICTEDLKHLIEPHFHEQLAKSEYLVRTESANSLLTHTRFDLAFKLFYLDIKEKNKNLAKKIYLEHIRAFSLGKFIEPGNEEKSSTEKFIEAFDETFESIQNSGFDKTKTLIPLSKNGSILNGAHRIASAIYMHKNVDCVQIETGDYIYDYKFFYQRNISQTILDMVATTFVKFSKNIHIAFIWPIGIRKEEEVETLIPNIVYKKEIKLSTNGAHNLLSQIYYGEEWLGSVDNNFSGSEGKLVECFKTFDSFEVIAFQANNMDEVLKIKDNIRELFSVGKHSIHITDTREEAVRVVRVVFNDNSLHFLNYAKPNKYKSTHKKIDKFKEFIVRNKINPNDIALDSGMILSVYGLREAEDIDYFLDDNSKLQYNDEALEYHDEALEYHDEEKIEMIYNQKYYFYFNDIKFISFKQLYKMKKNRDEEKDRNDYKMMEALIENNKFKSKLNKLKQNIFYGKVIYKQKGIKLLRSVGLFSVARKIYRYIKGYSE